MRIDRIKSELEILKLFLTISSAFFGTVVAGVIKNCGSLHGVLIAIGIVLAIFLAFFCWTLLHKFNKKSKTNGKSMSVASEILASIFLLFISGIVIGSMFWAVYQMNKNDFNTTTKEKTL